MNLFISLHLYDIGDRLEFNEQSFLILDSLVEVVELLRGRVFIKVCSCLRFFCSIFCQNLNQFLSDELVKFDFVIFIWFA